VFTNLVERFRSRVLIGPQGTGTGTGAYLAPTSGVIGIVVRAIVKMGNAADLALSLKYADDTSGTNATAFPVNVPIYVNGDRKSDGKSYTVEDSSGNFIVDFAVDPGWIPEGKTIGLSFDNSNASNLLAVELIEEVSYRPY
jgi:hypothetical protein